MNAQRANEKLLGFTMYYMLSQAFFAAARLGIADALVGGPLAVEVLAAQSGVQSAGLYRMLRLLAAHGLFREEADQRFALNDVAEYLRSDVPFSYRDYALMIARHYASSTQFEAGITTGESLFALHYGQPLFDYIGAHPELGPEFDRGMESLHGIETGAFLRTVDLRGVRTFADIGGGNGDVLGQVLRAHPAIEGILFDLPAVVVRTRAALVDNGFGARCRSVSGSFFEAIPVVADVYFLRHILHDWNDTQCSAILRNLAAVAAATSRIIVGESLIEAPNQPGVGKTMDMVMLQFTSGYERTVDEYRALFAAADLELVSVTPTASMISLLEARPRGHSA